MNELGSFFPLFYNNVSIFPFCNLSLSIYEQKKKKHRNKMVPFHQSIERRIERVWFLKHFRFQSFHFQTLFPRRNIFFPIQAYLTNKEKFFFSLSLPFISTRLFEEKINWISGQMNLNIPFLRYTLLAFDEMKIKRICKIRFVRDFSYLF